jgi:hypothetical protein
LDSISTHLLRNKGHVNLSLESSQFRVDLSTLDHLFTSFKSVFIGLNIINMDSCKLLEEHQVDHIFVVLTVQ